VFSPFSHSLDLSRINYYSFIRDYMSKVVYLRYTKFTFVHFNIQLVGFQDFEYCPEVFQVFYFGLE